MNRRDFAKSLAALGLAPALPAMPAAAPVSGFTPYMYGLGAHLARSTGGSSAAMLAKKLALTPEVAQAMQAQLVRNGVVLASSSSGLAVAAQPFMRGVSIPTQAVCHAGKSLRTWVKDSAGMPAPESDPESSAIPEPDGPAAPSSSDDPRS